MSLYSAWSCFEHTPRSKEEQGEVGIPMQSGGQERPMSACSTLGGAAVVGHGAVSVSGTESGDLGLGSPHEPPPSMVWLCSTGFPCRNISC